MAFGMGKLNSVLFHNFDYNNAFLSYVCIEVL